MVKKTHLMALACLIFCTLFFTNCKKKEADLSESVEPDRTRKIERELIRDLPFIPAQQEQVDAYSMRFDLSKTQSEDLISRETQLSLKLKTLSLDGSNGPEMVDELTKYCAALRHFLSNGSGNNHTNQVNRLSTEFLNDIPKGQPTEEFLDQLDNLKLGDISNKYAFEVRAIMGIINSLSQSRPDLISNFLIQQAAALPQSRLDSIIYSATLETALEHKVTIQTAGKTNFQNLRDAPNPVYRLLAIKLMAEFERDEQNLVDFYAGYVNEKDPLILGIAVQHLLKINTPEAMGIVSNIKNSKVLRSEPDIATGINEMIERHIKK